MVAAAFDEVTGNVIGMLHEPAFTGELTVRYLEPTPMNEPIEMRAWLKGRERRKLFIEAEARAGDRLVAICHAIYITVDPSAFAAAPDPADARLCQLMSMSSCAIDVLLSGSARTTAHCVSMDVQS